MTHPRPLRRPASWSGVFACSLLLVSLSGTADAQDAAGPGPSLTPALRAQLVDSVAAAIRQTYVFPAVGDSVARVIRERVRRGAYDASASIPFALQLTADLQALSHDRHLAVEYEPRSTHETVVDSAERRRRRAVLMREFEVANFGIPEVRVLDGNVGYVALTTTLSPDLAGELFANAMSFVARTDALILDLRANTGGDSDMPNLVLSYFYDEPVEIGAVHHRDPSQVEQSWTFSYVPGKRYRAARPLYVLMSDSTFSAAEAIAYTLQATKRATIVGARTKGGANSGAFHAIGSDLVLFVPSARVVSPITKTNWDGVGVIPDVAVDADSALRVAHDAALAKLGVSRRKG